MSVRQGRSPPFDGVAIAASLLCLVHCLLLPVIILLLPALAAFLTFSEAFHIWAIAVAVPTGVLALVGGYRRHHSFVPTWIVVPGLALLVIGALAPGAEWVETAFTVAGALVLSVGHVLNLRASRISTPIATAKAGL